MTNPTLEFILANLTEVDLDTVSTIKPTHCSSFSDLIDICRRGDGKNGMTVTQSFEDCLALCLAASVSIRLQGDPLWFYLVGAASSGKSTICDMICAAERWTIPLSRFTGIVSGRIGSKNLIEILNGKLAVINDGTLMLESRTEIIHDVLGELREIYGGSFHAHYRNDRTAIYKDIAFGMIIAITEAIYKIKVASLGERFLHIRLESDRQTEIQRNKSAARYFLEEIDLITPETGINTMFNIQKTTCAGFIQHIQRMIDKQPIIRPEYTEEDLDLIQYAADVVACSRADAARSKQDDIMYHSRPESSTRVVKQLSRTIVCLCYVFGVHEVTPVIRRLIAKVCLDSSFGRQSRVISNICTMNNGEGVQRHELSMASDLPMQSVIRIINDLASLGIVKRGKEESRHDIGRRSEIVYCVDWVRTAFQYINNHRYGYEETY